MNNFFELFKTCARFLPSQLKMDPEMYPDKGINRFAFSDPGKFDKLTIHFNVCKG
jgi:hypothetical protein